MNKYRGMTVNERLWVSGLADKFDLAVKKKDIDTVKSILKDVEVGKANINPILKQHGLIEKE
jgi:hypothetical protein